MMKVPVLVGTLNLSFPSLFLLLSESSESHGSCVSPRGCNLCKEFFCHSSNMPLFSLNAQSIMVLKGVVISFLLP